MERSEEVVAERGRESVLRTVEVDQQVERTAPAG